MLENEERTLIDVDDHVEEAAGCFVADLRSDLEPRPRPHLLVGCAPYNTPDEAA